MISTKINVLRREKEDKNHPQIEIQIVWVRIERGLTLNKKEKKESQLFLHLFIEWVRNKAFLILPK